MMSGLSTDIAFRFARRVLRRASLFTLSAALVLLPAVPSALGAPAKPVINAGYRTLSSSIPADRLMLHMGVWYPTARKAGKVKVGNWSFRSARGGNILDGPWPVIILSHDVIGSAWSHHDLASALAARGFIVAAPLHDRDNADDMRMLFTRKQLPLRAIQASEALDAILAHPQIGPQADRERVAFLGYGLTAPAGLLLAGGKLSADGWSEFRSMFGIDAAPAATAASSEIRGLTQTASREPDTQAASSTVTPQTASPTTLSQSATHSQAASPAAISHPASSSAISLSHPTATDTQKEHSAAKTTSPWCTPLLREKVEALVLALHQQELARQAQIIMQEKASLSHANTFARMKDSVARSHQRQMRMAKTDGIPLPPVVLPLLPPAPADKDLADPRFKAVALVSPGFSMLFTRDSLAGVSIPTLLVGAGQDPFQIPHEQAERLRSLLPQRPDYLLIPDASPASLYAPCPETDPLSRLDGICAPVPAELRQGVRDLLLDSLQVFFLRSFGKDVEAP